MTVLILPSFCSNLSLTISQLLILGSSVTALIFVLIGLFWHLQFQFGADLGKGHQNHSTTTSIIFCYLGCTQLHFRAFTDASVMPLTTILRKKSLTPHSCSWYTNNSVSFLRSCEHTVFFPHNCDKRKLQSSKEIKLRYWFLWFNILHLSSLLCGLLSSATDIILKTSWPGYSPSPFSMV